MISLLTSDVYLVWDFYFAQILLKLESHKKKAKTLRKFRSEKLSKLNLLNWHLVFLSL